MVRLRFALPLCLVWASLAPMAATTFEGRVLDQDGQAIVGARMLLYRTEEATGWVRLAEGASGGDGAYSLTDPDRDALGFRGFWTVFALVPGKAIAGREWREVPTEPADITLLEPGEITGRAWGADGQPIAGARVTLDHAWRPGNGRGDGARAFPLDLRDEFAVTTDAGGCFSLSLAPPGWRVTVVCEAEGYGHIERWGDLASFDFPFPPAGSIRGRIVGDVDVSQFEGFRFWVNSFEFLGEAMQASAEAKVGPDGEFVIHALPATTYHLGVREQMSETHHIRGRFNVEVKPGEETLLEFQAEPTVPFRGRVVDAETGEGLAGVHVEAYFTGRTIIYTTEGSTSHDGSFELPCLQGEAHTLVSVRRSGAGGPYESYSDPATIGPDGCDLGDVRLKRLGVLTVKVVDEAGKPVEGATVHCVGNEETWSDSIRVRETDARGEAEYVRLPGPVALSAEKGNASTVGETRCEVTGDNMEPVILALQGGALCGIRARVVLPDGGPVEGVEVRVESVEDGRIGGSGGAFSAADGTVSVEGLEPQAMHRLVATPNGATGGVTKWESAEPGETIDFGDLVIRPHTGVIAGTVVDSDGTPIAGASVRAFSLYQVGATALTDEAGAFRIEAVPPWDVTVLAEAQGYGLAGLTARPGAEDLRVVLSPPEAPSMGVEPPLPPEPLGERERVELALRVAEEAIETAGKLEPDGAAPWALRELLAEVARVAPDKAFEWTKGDAGAQDSVRIAIALNGLARDSQAALELLRACDPERVVSELLAETLPLAHENPDAARLRARASLEFVEAIPRASTKTLFRALAGRVLCLTGEPDGEAVLRQAVQEAEALGGYDWDGYARGRVAGALAVLDVDAALALLEPISDPDDRARHLANIAREVARTDPDRALELLGTIEEDFRREEKLAAVLAFFPPDKLDRAIELARGIEHHDFKVGALVRLATLAPPEKARELLEEVARAIEADDSYGSLSWHQDRGLAMLANVARRFGSGQARDFALRAVPVMEMRVRYLGIDRPSITGAAKTARALAYVDRDLARAVLVAGIRANGGDGALLSDTMVGGSTAGQIVAAAAEIDVEWAADLIRFLPAAPGCDLDAERLRAAAALVHRLLTPAEEREAELLLSPTFGSRAMADGWLVKVVDD